MDKSEAERLLMDKSELLEAIAAEIEAKINTAYERKKPYEEILARDLVNRSNGAQSSNAPTQKELEEARKIVDECRASIKETEGAVHISEMVRKNASKPGYLFDELLKEDSWVSDYARQRLQTAKALMGLN